MEIVRKRALIRKEFMDLYIQTAEKKLHRVVRSINSSRDKIATTNANRHILSGLNPLVEGDEKTIQLLIMKLHSMRFTQYGTDRHGSTDYFWGLTQSIIAKNATVHYNVPSREGRSRSDYDLGPYLVYISASSFVGKGYHEHFIPLREMNATGRHPHTYCTDGSSRRDHTYPGNPLDATPRHCFGDFGPLLSAAKADCDIAEYFNMSYTYLSRWMPGDTLIAPENIEFAKRI